MVVCLSQRTQRSQRSILIFLCVRSDLCVIKFIFQLKSLYVVHAEDVEIAEEYLDISLRTLRSLRDFIYTTFK